MKYTWLYFVIGAVLTWGAYVVTIDHGRAKLAEGVPPAHRAVAAMRAFLFIGLAYFVMGVLVPWAYLAMNKIPAGQDPGFNLKGSVLSSVAGILGAAGALCIVFAVGHARRTYGATGALYVSPLVFAFAPIINCIISIAIEPPHAGSWPTRKMALFAVGLLMAAGGAALVLYNKPEEGVKTPPKAVAQRPA
jgi:hypothetical protein